MWDAKQLARSSYHILAGRSATNLLTIGFTIYFAHAFSKEQFATIPVFALLVSITSMIGNLGFESNCLREIPPLVEKGSRIEAASLFKTTLANRALWSVTTCGAIFFGAKYIAILVFKKPDYEDAMPLLERLQENWHSISPNNSA